ncbi:MAG: cell division protein SepF [Bacilli bacterium]|nr:cell division protein SepF [Bacilli bacterium]
MGIEKLKNFITGDSGEELEEKVGDDGYYTTTKQEVAAQTTLSGNKVMLLEPRAYSESQQIADYLKNRTQVIVNMKRVTPDQAKRIIDFLSGTIYAIGGHLEKLGGGIFLATPNNISIEGTYSDDSKTDKVRPSSKKTNDDDDNEDDFF